MAPKGGNAKKESGRAKKAENEVSLRAIPSSSLQLVLALVLQPQEQVARAIHIEEQANPQAKKAEAAAAQKEKVEADKWKAGGTYLSLSIAAVPDMTSGR